MSIYLKTIKMHMKSALEYKKSFILTTIATFLLTFLMTISIYLLFEKFGSLEGWDFFDVAITFGIIMFAFSSSVVIMYHIIKASKLISTSGIL